MDARNQLSETTDWQEVELQTNAFGSFNKLRIKLEQPWLFCNSHSNVWLQHNPPLPTAKGYWSLDGREFVIVEKQGRTYKPIATLHVEDCGLGQRKAIAAVAYFGYKFKGFVIPQSRV